MLTRSFPRALGFFTTPAARCFVELGVGGRLPADRFVIFGDSHCNLYWGTPGVEPRHIGPVTMHKIGRDGLAVFEFGAVGLRDGDAIGFCFGEIDIRVHVARQIVRHGRAAAEILPRLVAGYLQTLAAVQREYPASKLVVLAAVPPAGAGYDTADEHFPRNGSDRDRAAWTRRLNRALRSQATRRGFLFLDQYAPFVAANGLLRLTASIDQVHVRNDAATKGVRLYFR